MTYLPTGLGAEPPGPALTTDFNDTRFPGVIYATNVSTHANFVELQKQLNRGAAAKGIATRIPTDGKLGSDTLALAGKVSLNTYAVSSLRNLAMNAVIVAQAAKAKADAAGIPSTLSAPRPASPPVIYNAQTDTLQPAPAASVLGFGLSTPMMLALGAAAIGIGYYVTKKGRK
jgi:hypothetical protein